MGRAFGRDPSVWIFGSSSSLYAGKVITVGTLLAVYMSTSDEMLPIMISNAVPVSVMLRILACKAGIAIFSGL